MNAPTLWIIIPGIIAAGLLFLRRKRRITAIIGIFVSCSLAILAWRFPIGEGLKLGIWPALEAFKIEPSISLLGRQLILDSSSRPILVLIYGGTAIWFIGSIAARTQSLFIPLGLATSTVLVGAIAVEPFFYAAPLIELAALVGIPLIAPQGQKISGGVYRFLVYQTTGMMILLFAGWMVSIVELNPSDPDMAIRATILLGLGFFLDISAFPFSTWIPMVAEKVQPYAAGFLFFMLSEVTALLGFKFIQILPGFRILPR
jgi:NADH-quinone oxidoreductase subunit N